MTSSAARSAIVWKGVDGWEDALSSTGAQARKYNINSSVCPRCDEVHDGNNKRFSEQQASSYPFSRQKITYPNWTSEVEMSLLD